MLLSYQENSTSCVFFVTLWQKFSNFVHKYEAFLEFRLRKTGFRLLITLSRLLVENGKKLYLGKSLMSLNQILIDFEGETTSSFLDENWKFQPQQLLIYFTCTQINYDIFLEFFIFKRKIKMITIVPKFCILLLIVGIIQAKRLKGDELVKLQKVSY